MQDRLIFIVISFVWSKTVFSNSPGDAVSHCPKYVAEGESLRCNCQFTNQSWPTTEGSVKWPRHSNNRTLIVTNVTRGDNGTVFTCLMTRGGVTETSNYTLRVAYGPQNVSIHAPSPFISDGTNDLHLTCVATEVNPVPRYTWNIATCLNNDTDKGRCVLKPQASWDDGKEVPCTATNTFGSAKVTATYRLNLPYPPPKPPEVLDYKPGQVLANGDHLQCRVSGGKPLVKKVNFSCSSDPPLEDQQDTIEGSSMLSNVTINAKDTEAYSMECVCSAIWEPREDLYTKTLNVTVFVSSDDQEREIASTKIKTGTTIAFPVVILFILVIVIAVVIHVKNRGRQRGMEKEILESCHQRDSLSLESRITCSDYEDVETPRNQPTSNVHNIHRSRLPLLNAITETGPSSQEMEDETFSSREHLCESSNQLGAQSTREIILNQSLNIIPSSSAQMQTTEDEPIYTEIDPPAQEDLGAFTATAEPQATSSSSGSATHKMSATDDKCVSPQASISSPKLKKNKSHKEDWEVYNTLQHR